MKGCCLNYLTPAEVLSKNICERFQRLYIPAIERDLNCDRVKTTIACKTYDKLIPPKVIVENKEILLHRDYINFLWAFCYGSWVVFEESVMKKCFEMKGEHKYQNKKIISRAMELRRSAEKKRIKIWFPSMPRPDGLRLSSKERWYSFKVNNIFLDALAILLFHEVGHVKFKHLDNRRNREKIDQIQCEQDCDNYAVDVIVGDSLYEDRFLFQQKIISVIIAFSAMLFLGNSPLLFLQDEHPDLDNRLYNVLSKYEIFDERTSFYIYLFADVIIRRFYNNYKSFYSGANIKFDKIVVERSKDLFDKDIDCLKMFFLCVFKEKTEKRKKMKLHRIGGYVEAFSEKDYLDGKICDYYWLNFINYPQLDLEKKNECFVRFYNSYFEVIKDCSRAGEKVYVYQAILLNKDEFHQRKKYYEQKGESTKVFDVLESPDICIL